MPDSGYRIIEIGDITRGEYTGPIRLEVLVDDDAFIQTEVTVAEKSGCRMNADTNSGDIAGNQSPGAGHYPLDFRGAAKLHDRFAKNELDASCSKILRKELCNLGRVQLLVKQLVSRDERRFDASRSEGRGHLHPDKACTDDGRVFGIGHRLLQGQRVIHRAQVMDALQVRSLHG